VPDHRIPRRDFLQGALVSALSTLSGPLLRPCLANANEQTAALFAAQDAPGYYPPALTGMRGSQPGSFEAAHALRDGNGNGIASATDSDEDYDLIVVGAGISGLSAAHFYRTATSSASRILILDNHDDFGGHARRNEFTLAGRLQLINGGTLGIDSPRPYSPVAAGLIRKLGIDLRSLSAKVENKHFYSDLGLRKGAFFDRETFGADALVVGFGSTSAQTWLAGSPLSERSRHDIERIEEGTTDFLPGLAMPAKKLKLSSISYATFLRDVVGADAATIAFYQARTHGWWGVGIDAISALDCWAFGYPGFQGMKLSRHSIARMGYTPSGYLDTGGSTTLHFPDGNATVARLLVRSLIPLAMPGHDAADAVSARVNYHELDRPRSPVRLRLNSTVVSVRNAKDAARDRQVDVVYQRDGAAIRVRGRACVLACWNMMIPYLCPDLPQTQKAALHTLVKTPLVYTNVALRNWRSFRKLGVSEIYAPGSYFSSFELNENVDIGGYRSPSDPEQPVLVRMLRTPCAPGLSEHEQNKAGRAELLNTPFATFENHVRDQLQRTLGPGGFDQAQDIQAITVNRWPHGYAPEYNPLFDADLPPEQRTNVIGRARHGRITIANSDAGAAAYTDSAIDQAHRAVSELLMS
jgi:spermidine dehydrogenase